MPYADDSAEAPIDSSLRLFRGKPSEDFGGEESEVHSPRGIPSCQEDPAYNYQYPGCTYTGSCPGAGPGSPAIPREYNGKPQQNFGLTQPAVHPLKPAPSRKYTRDEECPVHPEVDTMEFRRTDAKEGEFDRRPFNRPF